MLSAAAGIMLAATFFSLLLPALAQADEITDQPVPGGRHRRARACSLAPAACSRSIAWCRTSISCWARGTRTTRRFARIWLFVIAITLHNFPEGMAVGVGFAGGDIGNGTALAVGIGLQNMPEGFAVAISLVAIGYSRARAFSVATARRAWSNRWAARIGAAAGVVRRTAHAGDPRHGRGRDAVRDQR